MIGLVGLCCKPQPLVIIIVIKAKMHQIQFQLGLCPRLRWGSLQRSPDPLAGFGGRFAAGGRGWAGEKEGKGREGEVEGREREGLPSYC